MPPDRIRPDASLDPSLQVALRFAAFLKRQGQNEAQICAGFLAARAEQAGSVGVDLRDYLDSGIVLEALNLASPAAAQWLAGLQAHSPYLILDLEHRVYLRRQHAEEVRVAAELLRRLRAPPRALTAAAEQCLTQCFGEPGGAQAEAVRAALSRSLFVLAGGPGTGKTHSVLALLLALEAMQPGADIVLAAPTGKAAQRLREALSQNAARLSLGERVFQAGTVHRWLSQSERQQACHALIIDEASMLDLGLLARVLQALPENAPLILVGDPGQLASVESGRILGDLVEAIVEQAEFAGACHRLTHNFRAERELATLARAAASADTGEFFALLERHRGTLDWIPTDHAQDTQRLLRAELQAAARTGRRLNRDDAILTVHRQGALGLAGLNTLLDPHGDRDAPLRAGEPVMIVANAVELDVWNGDLGSYAERDGVPGVAIQRGDSERFVAAALLPKFERCYAMTVHKAQGSEFERVLLVLPQTGSELLTRELLYTAITRAKRQLLLIGPRSAIEAALANPLRRASGLKQRLKI